MNTLSQRKKKAEFAVLLAVGHITDIKTSIVNIHTISNIELNENTLHKKYENLC